MIECLPEKHQRPVARAKMTIKLMINSTRTATTIPMMGPVPSSSDPVHNANILCNFLMFTEKEQNDSIMFPQNCLTESFSFQKQNLQVHTANNVSQCKYSESVCSGSDSKKISPSSTLILSFHVLLGLLSDSLETNYITKNLQVLLSSSTLAPSLPDRELAMPKFGTKCLMLLDICVAFKVVGQIEELTMCSNSACNCTIICCRENCRIALLILLMSSPVTKTSLIK
jgi:hypothetical protein